MLQYFEIPHVEDTITNPIITGIVQRILSETGIKTDRIQYLGQLQKLMQPGSTTDGNERITFASQNLIDIEYNETRDEMCRINRGVGLNLEPPFLVNNDMKIVCEPIMAMYDAEIAFTYTSKSKSELNLWLNRFNALLDMGRYSNKFDSEAYYIIPRELLKIINAVYLTAEKGIKSGKTFKEVLIDSFTPEITPIGNVIGKQQYLCIKHAPTRIEVVYDTAPPVAQKDDSVYKATFSIKFQYQRPEEILISYPYIINQHMLPAEYCPSLEPSWLTNDTGIRYGRAQLNREQLREKVLDYVILPIIMTHNEEYLELNIPHRQWYYPIYVADILFEKDNLVNPDILSVNSLPYVWSPAIREYCEHSRKRKPNGMGCIFRFLAFADNYWISKEYYKWDCDWFTLKYTVNPKLHYRVAEVYLLDWSSLDESDLEELRNHPGAVIDVIDWLNNNSPGVDSQYIDKDLVDDWRKENWSRFPKHEWDLIVNNIGKPTFPNGRPKDARLNWSMLTQFNTNIISVRSDYGVES